MLIPEKIYLSLLLIFFLVAFSIRNFKTAKATKLSIRGKSTKLTLSILISTFIYGILFYSLFSQRESWIFDFDLSLFDIFNWIGLVLITIGFIIGLFALNEMNDSWRVGIKYDQETTLVTTGIFNYHRNPYFLSYNLLFGGYMLLFPSVVLLVLYIGLVVTFHKMILEEEEYLESVHGNAYTQYCSRVRRYL